MSIPEHFAVRDQRKPGWFYVDNEIIDRYGTRLGAYGVAVYNVLSRHERNHQVNLSQRDIAASLGISQDRVRKSLADLLELGLIYVEVPQRPSPGTISTIVLLDVKATERHTFSSGAEPNATRSPNKEVKTKTETEHPPTPLFEGVSSPKHTGLTSRDLRRLAAEMDRLAEARRGTGATDDELLQAACARLILPLDLAREAVARSCGEEVG